MTAYSLADARISKALRLIDTWLVDESPHDGLRQQLIWKHLREVRAALDGCLHSRLRSEPDFGSVDWECEDCGYIMAVHVTLTVDEARERMKEMTQ